MALADRRTGSAERPFWYLDIGGIPHRFLTHAEPAGWVTPGGRAAREGMLRIASLAIPGGSVSVAEPIVGVDGLDFVLTDDPDGTLANLFALYLSTRIETFASAELSRTSAGPLTVRSAASFPASGDLHFGIEAIGHTGKTATTFTGLTRGKYGGKAFRHRRVSQVGEGEAVSNQPTRWDGRTVRLYRNWLKPDGTAYDADYGGAHEEPFYVGTVVGLAQPSSRAREIVLRTNPLNAETSRPVAAMAVETTLAGDDEVHWTTGADWLVIHATIDGADTLSGADDRRHYRSSVTTKIGDGGPHSLGEIINALDDMAADFLGDGGWDTGTGNAKLIIRFGLRVRGGEGDGRDAAEDRRVTVEMREGAGERTACTIELSTNRVLASVGQLLGFDRDVSKTHAIEEFVADRPPPKRWWSSGQTRIYVEDASQFAGDQGVGGDDEGLAYVLMQHGDDRWVVPIDGVVTGGPEYLTVPDTGWQHLGRWNHTPGRRWHRDTGRLVMGLGWGGMEGDGPPVVRQVLGFHGRHPFDVARILMLSSGTAGDNHATWDVLPWIGAGLDLTAADIDVDSFDAAMVQEPLGTEWAFLFTEPIPLADWLAPILRALGCLLTMRRGRITLRPWSQTSLLAVAGAPTIDDSVHTGEASMDLGLSQGINQIVWSLGRSPLSGEWALEGATVQNAIAVDSSGAQAMDIGIPGLFPGPALLGQADGHLPTALYLTSLWLLSTLGRALPTATFLLNRRASDVWVGDVVLVSVKGLLNPKTGGYGFTSIPFQVVGKRFDQGSGRTEIQAVTFDGRGHNVAPYAPSGKVASYAAGPPVTITLVANAYSLPTGAAGAALADADPFGVLIGVDGSVAAIVVREGDEGTLANVTITAQAGNVLTLSGAPAFVPVAGDRVRLQDYDSVGAGAKARHAWQADGTKTLGAAGDAAFTWGEGGGRG